MAAGAHVLLALPGFEDMLGGGPGLVPGAHSVERFANGELHVQVKTAVTGCDCLVVGSIAPPDSQMTSLLLLADTVGKEGAASVTALLPYLAYTRQDRDEPGASLAAGWTGRLLQASGVSRVLTVDIHSPMAARLFPIPVESLSPASLFAAEIGALGFGDYVVVAPDEGGAERAADVAAAAGAELPVAVFTKRRTAEGITHTGMRGELAPRAFVVDDILDTGGTLVSCCRALREAGVEEITVFVTHGLFTGTGWQELWQLGVTRLYTTDSIPGARGRAPRATVLALRELWLASLARTAVT